MAHVAPWYMPLKPRHTCYIPRDACVPRHLSHGVSPGECHGHRGIFPMAPLTIFLLSKQYDTATHGPFHSLSDGRPMTYLPCKTFHAKKPSMDDRWVALRLNHDATLGMAHVAPWYMPLKPRHTCYIPRDACVPRDLSHGVRPGECHGHRGIFPMAPLTIFYYRNKLMALSTACPMGGP